MSNIRPLSRMTESETIEAMADHLKRGADIARRLAKVQGKEKWNIVAQLLDKLYYKSNILASSRSLNRTDTLFLLDQEQKKLNAEETKKPLVH